MRGGGAARKGNGGVQLPAHRTAKGPAWRARVQSAMDECGCVCGRGAACPCDDECAHALVRRAAEMRGSVYAAGVFAGDDDGRGVWDAVARDLCPLLEVNGWPKVRVRFLAEALRRHAQRPPSLRDSFMLLVLPATATATVKDRCADTGRAGSTRDADLVRGAVASLVRASDALRLKLLVVGHA